MVDATKPFHMQGSEESPPQVTNAAQDEQYIDIGSIQTNPSINYAEYVQTGRGLFSKARIDPDGRIIISLDLKQQLPDLPPDYAPEVHEFGIDKSKWMEYPSMNIVIMIVGSRGDVQPYVALGKRLLQDGHRIRIASHGTFRSFVHDAGLEFFDIGGNPQELMSYMVKNPGLIPGFESLTNGDIGRKRQMLSTMMEGCWKSCHSTDPQTGRPFVADAIISNPPAFAHIHCAEAMGIPLLLTFTMPWSPTTAFPHPLVNIQSSNAQSGLTNYLSYALADIFTWQGIGDIVNKFRRRSLGLPALSLKSGAGVLDNVKVPWTYCMSSGLVPKPKDWKSHIDVVGFYFLDLATDFTPPDDLVAFLAAGEPPVYIGFGSVVVDDPASMTNTIFEATRQAGVRALVSAGWGGLGGVSIPPHIFILGNIPHDWLFANERVSAVVWWSTEHCLKFSAFAAQTLMNAKLLDLKGLDLHRPKEYETHKPPSDPLTGGASAIFWTVTHYYGGIAELFYSPVKGIIHTTTAIPKGVMKIVSSIHEGFHNMPKLYGSDVRQPGKVTDLSSGVKEAGKGLFYGYYDGITGLVREPWQGAQKGGFTGAVKGAGRSFINATMRPAAGIVGVVANPIQGAWKSAQTTLVKEQGQPHYQTRMEEGLHAVESSSENERVKVVKRFKDLMQKEKVIDRKKNIAKAAEEVMYESGKEEEKLKVEKSSRSISTGSAPSDLDLKESEERTTRDTNTPLDEAMFERDLELAKRLSLYEQ